MTSADRRNYLALATELAWTATRLKQLADAGFEIVPSNAETAARVAKMLAGLVPSSERIAETSMQIRQLAES